VVVNTSFYKKGLIHTQILPQHDALGLKQTAYVVESFSALGKSKRLSYDVYDAMDDSISLFAKIGIGYSYRVTKTEEVYFSLMQKPAQEHLVQRANILRFSKEAGEIGQYVMRTKLDGDLNEKTYLQLLDLVESFRETFGLDANNIPVSTNMDNCLMKEFLHHRLKKVVFVDDMEQFWMTPAPRPSSGVKDYGLRANSEEFKQKIYRPNIAFAY